MDVLLDKSVIFALSIGLYLQNADSPYMVVPVIIAIGATAFNNYFEHPYVRWAIFGGYAVICLFEPNFLYFLPLLAYDVFDPSRFILFAIPLLLIIIHYKTLSVTTLFLLLFLGVAYFMKYRTTSLNKLKREYISLRDTTKEFSIQLENKNKELMEKQDYEINTAILNERNRIAREIHDNVGHLLSSAILQIGAMLALTKNETEKQNLITLKQTLSEGLDSIRNSIHNLHDESIDLYSEIQKIIHTFHACTIDLDYDIENPLSIQLKYTFISIIKEALANVIKHSDATYVSIILREHPALYQLVIKDNGTKEPHTFSAGIGLKNMTERVNKHKGIINVSYKKGFVIFISIPKE